MVDVPDRHAATEARRHQEVPQRGGLQGQVRHGGVRPQGGQTEVGGPELQPDGHRHWRVKRVGGPQFSY